MLALRTLGFALLMAPLSVAQISGVVRDPSGEPVSRASVTLAGSGDAALTSATDGQGRFRFDRLKSGAYRLAVSAPGFESVTKPVELGDKPVDLSIALELEGVKTSVTVTAGSLRNSDPNYQALRRGKLQKVWRVKDLVLKRDAATFTFRSGSFSFLPPVLGRVAAGVFTGDGNLKLSPAGPLAARYMKALTHAESADEDFTAMVVYFTDSTFAEVTQKAELMDESPKPLEAALEEIQSGARRRTDPGVSYLETLLGEEDVPNNEADLLAQLYNGEAGGFKAFIRGRKHAGLRFILNPRGALPAMPAAEEVALLNYATLQDADGIWYLGHLASEQAAGKASANEDHRLLAPERYQMDVSVSQASLDLTVECHMRFRTLRDGVRMARFQLLPDLEVSSVTLDGGPIAFVQENRRHDGSFYLQFPEALSRDGEHELVFHYKGGGYIREAMGQRAYAIQPLRPWYPRIDSVSRALLDITLRVPRGMTAVSVGMLARKTSEGSQDVFEWRSDQPLPPVGFNYGPYVAAQRRDEKTGYLVESYLIPPKTVPVVTGSRIGAIPPLGAGTPIPIPTPSEQPTGAGAGVRGPMVSSAVRSGAVSGVALANARNSVELFEHWFGPLPYGRLGVVESVYAGSLPGLIFLPAAALGGIPMEAYGRGMTKRVERALDEALPTVASRQWWGGSAMPASFHEAWLTRGLADFSAALYDEATGDSAAARAHWASAHDAIMGQDFYGLKIREAPPVWFGAMTDLHSTILGPPPALYQYVSNTLLQRKGGFIFQMLRQLMRDPETGDRDFIAMMHDFTSQYANSAASTEDFRAIVEKHMKPTMALDRSANMAWFFDEWVYGNDLPSYRMNYTTERAASGVKLRGAVTQSGVGDSFRMRVRVYVVTGKRTIPAVRLLLAGNGSAKFEMDLPEEPKEALLNAEDDVLAARQETHRVKALDH